MRTVELRPETVLPQGVSIVIPCLNESRTLARCIQEAERALATLAMAGEVIVAENGSTDESAAIARHSGARVIEVSAKGYGAALDAGISAARFAYVVFLDADLSYPFDEIEKLVAPLARGEAELVLGSRLRGNITRGAMPFLNRYLGTPVLTLLIRWLYGLPTTDCNSGMRAILRSRYPDLELCCPGMEFASEMLVRAGQKRLRYIEVPISFRRDQRGVASHLNRWRDGWRHLCLIFSRVLETA